MGLISKVQLSEESPQKIGDTVYMYLFEFDPDTDFTLVAYPA